MRTATETREYDNGDAVGMQDNRDGRQGQRQRELRTSKVVEMRENRDGYDCGGDTGRQKKIFGIKEMAKWVRRTATEWENTNRGQLPT